MLRRYNRIEPMAGRMKKLFAICACILLPTLVWTWYSVAADYGYKTVSGMYVFDRDAEHSTLTLKPDGRFDQELTKPDYMQRTQGRWRCIGEGGVAFSEHFLTLSGQTAAGNGQLYGSVEKRFGGLFVSSIGFMPDGPVFHKISLR